MKIDEFLLRKKITELKKILSGYRRVVLAFSGGKDSYFLLKNSIEVLGKDSVVPVFIITDFISESDICRVKYFKEKLKIAVKEIFIDLFSDQNILNNTVERCYFCKKKIFEHLKKEVLKQKAEAVIEGTTYSDLTEFRPGRRALTEMKIQSPLKDVKILSGEVIFSLKKAGIRSFFLTSSTCLATRFPYNHSFDLSTLSVFNRVESYLIKKKIYPLKVRFIPEGIRIETSEINFQKIIRYRKQIIDFCRKENLRFISLDIEGIKSGCWD